MELKDNGKGKYRFPSPIDEMFGVITWVCFIASVFFFAMALNS